jgi:hypothetical protein
MNEDVAFWKWIDEKSLGLVTETSVYHWDIFDSNQAAPAKMFERNANLSVSDLATRRDQKITVKGRSNHQLSSQRRRQLDGSCWHLTGRWTRRRRHATLF